MVAYRFTTVPECARQEIRCGCYSQTFFKGVEEFGYRDNIVKVLKRRIRSNLELFEDNFLMQEGSDSICIFDFQSQ